jgi:hypothetical protein
MAREMARQRLRDMLRHHIDPVPCPRCGWFQEEMLPLLRNRRLQWLRGLGITCLVLGGLAAAGTTGWAQHRIGRHVEPPLPTLLAAVAAAAIALVLGAALLFVRHLNIARYDPNDPETNRERIDLGRSLTLTDEEAAELREDE